MKRIVHPVSHFNRRWNLRIVRRSKKNGISVACARVVMFRVNDNKPRTIDACVVNETTVVAILNDCKKYF